MAEEKHMPQSHQASIAEINRQPEHAHDQAAASRTQNTHLTAHEETRKAEEQERMAKVKAEHAKK
jgi:hypothetical protein